MSEELITNCDLKDFLLTKRKNNLLFASTGSQTSVTIHPSRAQARDLRASAGSDFLALALCFTQGSSDIFRQPRNAKTTARKLGKSLTGTTLEVSRGVAK